MPSPPKVSRSKTAHKTNEWGDGSEGQECFRKPAATAPALRFEPYSRRPCTGWSSWAATLRICRTAASHLKSKQAEVLHELSLIRARLVRRRQRQHPARPRACRHHRHRTGHDAGAVRHPVAADPRRARADQEHCRSTRSRGHMTYPVEGNAAVIGLELRTNPPSSTRRSGARHGGDGPCRTG